MPRIPFLLILTQTWIAGDTITFTFALPEYLKDPPPVQHSATRLWLFHLIPDYLILIATSRVDFRRSLHADGWWL